MGETKEGQEFKSARIVPTFTPSERKRFETMCKAKGYKYFSSHLHDLGMAEVEEYEASLT